MSLAEPDKNNNPSKGELETAPLPVEEKVSSRSHETAPSEDGPAKQAAKPTNALVARETIESLAVAFILALLFKAFIAEAFVIPTGSMAPTLMGAHKDVVCECCGYAYQCGASSEFDEVGARRNIFVVGTMCPLCRKAQKIDPRTNGNHITFSGDRILVSKLAYVWNSPRRWEVIVFKFIEHARQNYIKRCLGLPNETVRVREGDVYIRSNTDADAKYEIARKPPRVINAMLQPVNDTRYIPAELVKAGLPSPWQPQDEADAKWAIEWTMDSWKATADSIPKEKTSWLRYYHRVVDPVYWDHVQRVGSFPVPLKPRQPRLITDFTAYNSGMTASVSPYSAEYADFIDRFVQNESRDVAYGNDGLHWTGDLASEFDLQTAAGTQSLSLLLVESGVRYVVRIDLSNGNATAQAERDGNPIEAFQSEQGLESEATATTDARAGQKFTVKFANVDDQLVLWVNGTAVEWSPSGRLNTQSYLSLGQRVPREIANDPLDGAPVGIGVSGGGLVITRAKVFRDIYYIAHGPREGPLTDYSNPLDSLKNSILPGASEDYARNFYNMTLGELLQKMGKVETVHRNVLVHSPEMWGKGPISKNRRTYDFTMKDNWYFPMGDNSSHSSDARSWEQHHTPQRLMIGRAVVVFWPHYWKKPIPFLPNFQRMGLIR